jgi:hypothetical protein
MSLQLLLDDQSFFSRLLRMQGANEPQHGQVRLHRIHYAGPTVQPTPVL